MYESSYSLVNTDLVNVKSGDTVTALNKNLKYNPAKIYNDLFTRTANLFNALSTDTIDDIEVVTKKNLSQKVDTVQLYTRTGELIPDNKFDWYKINSYYTCEFCFENPSVPVPTLGLREIKRGSSNTKDIGLCETGRSLGGGVNYYRIVFMKSVELTVGNIYTVNILVDFAVNYALLTMQIEIKE